MTSLLSEELATQQAYDAHALEWGLAHSDPGFWGSELVTFADMLPPPARILEVGVGAGRDAAELIAAGYDYTGIDFSENMLALARHRVPRADFRHLSVYDLQLAGKPYDGFWAACSLLHVPRSRIDEALTAIRRCLSDKAAGFIAMKQGSGEGFSNAGQQHMERFYAWWQISEFTDVLERNGFDVMLGTKPGPLLSFFVRAS